MRLYQKKKKKYSILTNFDPSICYPIPNKKVKLKKKKLLKKYVKIPSTNIKSGVVSYGNYKKLWTKIKKKITRILDAL